MKAVLLDADDHYGIATLDTPVPGPGQVAIRAAFAGVQWGDTMVRDGHFPVPRPFVPGFEVTGHIAAVGEGVDASRVGEPVIALTTSGAYAEVVAAPAALAVGLGETSLRTAAGLGWGAPTAYDLIHTAAAVRPGDRVLIHAAAGAVGTLAVQVARLAGAGRIVGVAGSGRRAEYAARFGYDRVLLRDEFPVALDESERFDVILDPVGGATRLRNLERLAEHGRLVAYGNLGSYEPVTVDANDLLMRGQSLVTHNGNLLGRTDPDRLARSVSHALDLVAAGQVRVDITAEYDLADVATAVGHLADGTTLGKSILRIA